MHMFKFNIDDLNLPLASLVFSRSLYTSLHYTPGMDVLLFFSEMISVFDISLVII